MRKIEIKNWKGFYVNEMGRVSKIKYGQEKILTARKVNHADKQLHVTLHKKGLNKVLPVRYIVLNAFYGEKDKKCYKAMFLNGDVTDCSVGNLRWVLRKNIALFDILTDREFDYYKEALKELKWIEKCRKANEVWTNKYLQYLKSHPKHSASERQEFFKNMFQKPVVIAKAGNVKSSV